jgi:hypothetical protein
MNTTMKTLSALAIVTAALATTLASPALAGRNITGTSSVGHINVAVGRFSPAPPPPSHPQPLVIVQGGRVPMPKCPGGCIRKNVGQGDTIDQGGPGEWEEINGNLPGKGPWGN